MIISQVVILGRCERKEFAEPYRQCIEMLENIGVEYRVNPIHANESENTSLPLFLFFQSYPQEFAKSDLARLRRASPFAPFFFILGACCEGMLRTAGPLNSPFYCYVHAWSCREIEQIRRFLTDQPSLFSLPLTAENDEITLWFDKDRKQEPADSSRECGTTARILLSAVCRLPSLILTHFGPFGNDSAMNRLIADEQTRLGHKPVFSGKTLPDDFAGKIFADADNSPPEIILESIQRIRRRFADNDFTVYVDSPRFDEKNGYILAGVTRVLPKIR